MLMAEESLSAPSLQYGAFALCVFMLAFCVLLWKSNRDERRELGAVIAKKDDSLLALARDNVAVVRENADALRELTEALKHRPCLHEDRVFDSRRELTARQCPPNPPQ